MNFLPYFYFQLWKTTVWFWPAQPFSSRMTGSLPLLQVNDGFITSTSDCMDLHLNVVSPAFFFFHPLGSAVGIQMKLEFFQRKFWTACRQVTNKLAPAWWKQNMKSPIVWEPSYLCFAYSAPLWTGSAASVAITRWEKSQTLWFSRHALIHLHWQFDPFTLLAGYQLLPHRQQRFHPRHRGAISGNPLTLWKVSHSLTHSPEQNVPQPFQDVLWSSKHKTVWYP